MKDINLANLILSLQAIQAKGITEVQFEGTLMSTKDGNNIILSTEKTDVMELDDMNPKQRREYKSGESAFYNRITENELFGPKTPTRTPEFIQGYNDAKEEFNIKQHYAEIPVPLLKGFYRTLFQFGSI